MVLQSMQLLLVAVTSLQETLIALPDGLQLVAQTLKLVVTRDVGAFCSRDVVI